MRMVPPILQVYLVIILIMQVIIGIRIAVIPIIRVAAKHMKIDHRILF